MKRALKNSVVGIAIFAMCMSSNAGFMDDFYASAGAAANVTPAQVVSGQAGTYITGGSAVWRVPNKTFTPFRFQQPSIKSGCGGIDFFGGSFGFANSTDFVNYLRNVGQNSIGLFFQVALKAMSPLLADTIKEISTDIQEMNRYLGSSCQAAQALTKNMDTWMTKTIQDSSLYSAASGATAGIYEGYKNMKTSLNNTIGIGVAPGQGSNSGGGKVGAEVNVTWAMLNAGSFAGGTYDETFVAMNLIGTKVYRKKLGSDELADPVAIGPQLELQAFAGRWNDVPIALPVFTCPADLTNACVLDVDLNRNGSLPNFESLARKSYNSMVLVRDAIISRTDINTVPGGADAMRMLGATRLPVFKLIEVTSTPGTYGISEMLIRKFADLMGLDMASNYVAGMAIDITKAAQTSRVATSSISESDLNEVAERVRDLKNQVEAYRTVVNGQVGNEADLISLVQNIERTMYSSFNIRLMDNLKYANRAN